MDWAAQWNLNYAEAFPVSTSLLNWSFATRPAQTPVVIPTEHFDLLCKADFINPHGGVFRLHLPVPKGKYGEADLTRYGEACKERLIAEAKRRRCTSVAFGAGDYHLFPGVPFHKDLALWLRWILPKGAEVVDFMGHIERLLKLPQNQPSQQTPPGQTGDEGTLRTCQNATEESALVAFVTNEFEGRWARDISDDFRNNLLNHYFGYFIDGVIVGYVRLYGWPSQGTEKYWGPGIYFALPGEKTGGLGPIGVAKQARGRRVGSQILLQALKILQSKGCLKVRVDWTTEIEFYQNRGMSIVSRYQPASIPI